MPLTHTITFDDPAEIAQDVRALSGLEFLQRLVARQARVPIGATLGFWLVEVGEGHSVFEAEAGPHVFNPIGSVQGGWYGAVLDAALGVCFHATLPAGVGYTTIEFKVNIVRAVTPATGRVRATGRIVHRGKRTGVTEARLEDLSGQLYAYATATQLVLDG
jgi:uncharacterized protein (TIGR00369 family)